MAFRQTTKIDEHNVVFNDTRIFALERWNDATNEILESHTRADRATILEYRDWQTLADSIKDKATDSRNSMKTKSFLNYLKAFPSTLIPLVHHLIEYTPGYDPEFLVLWGSIELNTRLARESTERSSRSLKWTKKLRGVVEVFNKCMDTCEEVDKNEARVKLVDVLEAILRIFNESILHFRSCATDTKASFEWPAVDKQIHEYIFEIETAGKHLGEMTAFSKLNQQRQIRDLAWRHVPVPPPEENVSFPIIWLNNRGRNEEFYGRKSELQKIDSALDHTDNKSLQTYTIYGRRGVGKTDIALEYACSNPSQFDAIFWIKCETAIAIRQSYNDVAVELGLQGADRHGHHEENQLAVLRWLKTTHRRWLLVFDNAENEDILQGYWPLGAKGSILITSRTYYNFLKDSQRKGDTVKPFNEADSWQLLMRLLGPKWVEDDRNDMITQSEENAGKRLLKDIGGLALAIRNVAGLVNNELVGDGTIEKTYKAFLEEKAALPDRPGMPRSDIVKSLDSLWNITFRPLTRGARSLLSVLALLSPDGIPIDLFLPKNQRALDGKLAFCKQEADEGSEATDTAFLADVINVPVKLQKAIDELVRYRLITKEGRVLFAHRVVQEAMNYHSAKDLQECIDSAAALVYEAFPKQVNGDYMASQWQECHEYISHGAQLSRRFARLRRGNLALVGSDAFVRLLCNCARYLYEISDYGTCVKVCETAREALVDPDSILHADICSSAGSALYEQNRLEECRVEWERFFHIQEEKLPFHSLERSASYNNMGNLEYAVGNLAEAKRCLETAIQIRQTGGDEAAGLLATSYLCISRVHYANKDYKTAFHMVGKSESLFIRTIGAAAHFMAYVHFAYGNIYYMQEDWTQAKSSYDKSLKIALATAAVHPITIAIYYSLGCVEFARNGSRYVPSAQMFLDKALTIAQLRCPQRDDGTITRILWKSSVVLRSHPTDDYQDRADSLALRAQQARITLNSSGQGKVVGTDDDDYVLLENEDDDEEESYDALVPGFFR